ncbi:MAG: hypothetical protein IJ713_04565 [Oscillibacter sp.]|nr:hypothetical protein [Oscillibacter sp.]
MDKGALLDRVGASGEERMLLARVLDRAAQAQSRNVPAHTDFLTPQERRSTEELLRLSGTPETGYVFLGGYDGAERTLALFLPDWLEAEDAEVPIRGLRAAFRKEDGLTHRDLLGSLMAMGVAREKVGDILVGEDSADVLVLDTVADFLLQSWESAGRARLRLSPVDLAHLHIPEVKCREVRDTVSSLRLDAVAAAGFQMARGKAAELISAGRVQVNWQTCTKGDKVLSQGDTVSARGFGKLELAEVGGVTRKGRTSITIKRY